MGADTLLSALNKVRQTKPGHWIACCPAHADRSPSLTIRETDNGKTLIHCFAGCSVQEVLDAVGLELDVLFPPRETHHGRPEPRPVPASDALRCLSFEGMLIASAGRSMLNGTWNEEEQERLVLAVARINGAMSACGVRL